MKYVQGIGLEVEGGWFAAPSPSPVAHWHRDGSVRNIRATQNGKMIHHVGEISSSPLPNLEAVKTWINDFWPDRKNKSCGFHIHLSVKPEFYELLMQESFYNKFLDIMKETGEKLKLSKHFFDRLENKNSFCRRIFQPHEQAGEFTKTDRRYCHLNYCYSLHGTIENRLPCANLSVKHAFEIVKSYIKVVEDFLEDCPKPKEKTFTWKNEFKIEEDIDSTMEFDLA